MIPTLSTVVHQIDAETNRKLKQELTAASWTLHHDSERYLKGGALRFGESSWLIKTNDWLMVMENNCKMFTESFNLASKFLKDNQKFGRMYWHKLRPGDRIELHDDSAHAFSKYIQHRYQVFLDLDEGFEIFCDNEVKDTKKFSNAVVDFNLLAPHAYKNNSSKPVYLMVFDIFDKDFLPVFGTP